ncbi:hypothetical protein HY522_06360 [bacterium]|nr:hypothetical protein [bacterium]
MKPRMLQAGLVGLILTVAAMPAAARILYHPEYDTRVKMVKSILLLEPNVQIATQHKSTVFEAVDTEQAIVRTKVLQEVEEIFRDRGFKIVFWDPKQLEAERRDLYYEVIANIQKSHKESAKLIGRAGKAITHQQALGEQAATLAAMAAADAIGYVSYNVTRLSEKAVSTKKTQGFIIAVATGITTPIIQATAVCDVSIFEGTSGEMLWMNSSVLQNTGTFMGVGQLDISNRYWALYMLEMMAKQFPEFEMATTRKAMTMRTGKSSGKDKKTEKKRKSNGGSLFGKKKQTPEEVENPPQGTAPDESNEVPSSPDLALEAETPQGDTSAPTIIPPENDTGETPPLKTQEPQTGEGTTSPEPAAAQTETAEEP